MLKRAATVGIPARRAYGMTAREIAIEAYGFNERAREEFNRAIRIAHLTAYLSRCKPDRFPRSADELIPKRRKPETKKERGARIRSQLDAMVERTQNRGKRKKRK